MFSRFYRNILGWSSQQKIVVFESDDWGSHRFQSKKDRDYFLKEGYPINKCWMSNTDMLESNSDLMNLFSVLSDYRDEYGNGPKFTMVMNPASPDYTAIQEANFETYTYKTIADSKDWNNLKYTYLNALDEGLMEMGFHGREHVNVNRWLRELNAGNQDVILGFSRRFNGFSKNAFPNLDVFFRASFEVDSPEDLIFQKYSILDGMDLLHGLFGTNVEYFQAPNGPISLSLLPTLRSTGIRYVGFSRRFVDSETNEKSFIWLGKKMKANVLAITRNCFFEPVSPKKEDWVSSCLSDVSTAFKCYKPAIISTHRANYVTGMEQKNGERGIQALRDLLKIILTKWPDVLFLSSSELGSLMNNDVSFNDAT